MASAVYHPTTLATSTQSDSRTTSSKPPLFLVRHGAASNVDGRIVGQVDVPLSETGAASIRALAATWSGPAPLRVWASDLARSHESAKLLADHFEVAVSLDPRLREIDFGNWDGARWEDVREHDRSAFERFMDRWFEETPPGGETYARVEARAVAWLDQVWIDSPGPPVVAVAHGGTIRAILRHTLDLPVERIFHLHLHHGRVSALGSSWRGPEVQLLNADRFPVP